MGTRRFGRVGGATVLALAALTAGAAAGQGGPKVAPRDVLTVAVFGVDQLSGKYPVDADGLINFPLIGAVKVLGLTAREVEAALEDKLRGQYLVNPQITVDLVQTPTRRVIVTGAVLNPGILAFAGELTLFEAIVRAGSTTAEAGDEVLVIRAPVAGAGGADPDDDGVIEVDLKELERGGSAARGLTLQDGDQVVVRKALQIFISGHVRSPGAFNIQTGTTVLQALTLAGGLTDRGTTRGLRIIRGKEEVKDVKLDTVVKPGDTIIVKARVWVP